MGGDPCIRVAVFLKVDEKMKKMKMKEMKKKMKAGARLVCYGVNVQTFNLFFRSFLGSFPFFRSRSISIGSFSKVLGTFP